jgi:hypothetical protein
MITTDSGLLIPKEELARWGEWVVERQEWKIVIRPKSMTEAMYGFLRPLPPKVSEALMEVIESGELDFPEQVSDGKLAP